MPFVVFLIATTLSGQALFVKPVKVLGDPHFIGTAANPLLTDSTGPNVVEGREVNVPFGIAVDNSVSPPIIYIADTGNNRVLGYQYNTQLTAGAQADLILGQPDRFTNLVEGPASSNGFSTGLNSPTGLAVDASGNLYVADTNDNRILRYPKPFSQAAGYQFPDLIIGQTTFSGSSGNTGGIKATTLLLSGAHTGLAFDSAGNLWVADSGNNRVLRYPVAVLKSGQNGPAADLVLGQADFVSNTAGNSRTSKSALSRPTSVAFDAAGRMLVADGLARVLVYAPAPATNTPALRILGVDTTQNAPRLSAINVGGPISAVATGSNVVVLDSAANRILVYQAIDSWPNELTQFSPTAVAVVGQATFTDFQANEKAEATAGSVAEPADAALAGGELFVADAANNRVLVYSSNAGGLAATASRVIGQLDFPDTAPNLVEGKEFNLAGSLTSGISGSAILDLTATPAHLYVADSGNNRILGFNDFRHAIQGQKADIVIGQPDFSRTTTNYPTGDPAQPNAQGLSGPTSLALDSAGNLYVSDTFNSRILRFPAPFASGTKTLETADLVIGQASFTSTVTDPTERTMSAPISIAFTTNGADNSKTDGYLVAADVNHNRVLFFPKPFSNGMSATKVIGQPSFNSTATSGDVTRLNSPRGVAVDPNDHVVVADTGNSRVQVYDTLQNLPNAFATPTFSLAAGLTGPVAVAFARNGTFWVANGGANSLAHYPSVDQLPLKNYASDATQPANAPRSAFVDSYNNLLVADGVNRVLYFAPGLGIVNAANFISGRALAPGTFASVFPSPSSNILASGTATASALPLPTTLSDAQVLVNNTPASLFFVSPGQINFPLSLALPTAGSVDVQVVSQSTGQVFGAAEVPLNTASPGLFTNASGSGEVASVNEDGSYNAPNAPITRGHIISLYGTGQGPVPNPPDEGFAATGLTPTVAHPQILLGPAATAITVPDANIQYSGLAPTLVGVWQINFTVPTNAPSGSAVPIKVLMNSIPSDNPSVPGQIAATISIK